MVALNLKEIEKRYENHDIGLLTIIPALIAEIRRLRKRVADMEDSAL